MLSLTTRDFNTAGPVRADWHYCIAPLERVRLAEVLALIRKARYFVLHAPRQTGKTSLLLTLRDLLNGGSVGAFRCVYVNVEPAQAAREDVGRAMRYIVNGLGREARATLGDSETLATARSLDAAGDPTGVLEELLTLWAAADPRPLILLIDEVDSLVGDTLISVLRQIRAGYVNRPGRFPQSVISAASATCAITASTPMSARRSSPAAAPSTSRSSRSVWATSARRRFARCSASTPPRPGSASRRTRSGPCGNRPADSPGWSTRWPGRCAFGTRSCGCATVRWPRAMSLLRAKP